jgi:prephenate dehydratase
MKKSQNKVIQKSKPKTFMLWQYHLFLGCENYDFKPKEGNSIKNLKKLTKHFGLWGWWTHHGNNRDYHHF